MHLCLGEGLTTFYRVTDVDGVTSMFIKEDLWMNDQMAYGTVINRSFKTAKVRTTKTI